MTFFFGGDLQTIALSRQTNAKQSSMAVTPAMQMPQQRMYPLLLPMRFARPDIGTPRAQFSARRGDNQAEQWRILLLVKANGPLRFDQVRNSATCDDYD